MTLRGRTLSYAASTSDGVTYVTGRNQAQRRLWVRVIFFVVIGWWLGGPWMLVAWLVGLPIVTLPLSVDDDRVGGIMTLLRY